MNSSSVRADTAGQYDRSMLSHDTVVEHAPIVYRGAASLFDDCCLRDGTCYPPGSAEPTALDLPPAVLDDVAVVVLPGEDGFGLLGEVETAEPQCPRPGRGVRTGQRDYGVHAVMHVQHGVVPDSVGRQRDFPEYRTHAVRVGRTERSVVYFGAVVDERVTEPVRILGVAATEIRVFQRLDQLALLGSVRLLDIVVSGHSKLRWGRSDHRRRRHGRSEERRVGKGCRSRWWEGTA